MGIENITFDCYIKGVPFNTSQDDNHHTLTNLEATTVISAIFNDLNETWRRPRDTWLFCEASHMTWLRYIYPDIVVKEIRGRQISCVDKLLPPKSY